MLLHGVADTVGLAGCRLLSPLHGRMLTELANAGGAELVWATYWQNRANTWIAPRVGTAATAVYSDPVALETWSMVVAGLVEGALRLSLDRAYAVCVV